MTKEEMAKAYSEGFIEEYREIAYDAFLCGYGAKCSSEIQNDLEEAAGEYEKNHTYQRYDGGGLTPEYDATLAESFIAGYNLCKEQMMKEAVEGDVCIPNVWVEHKEGKELVVRAEISKELGFKFGEKVRVIVLPKED